MPRQPDPDEDEQTTEKGLKIPVPKHKDVFEALRKVAPPVEPSDDDAGSPQE